MPDSIPIPPVPADNGGRYLRRSHTFDAASVALLLDLCRRHGRSGSEILRLALLSMEGNHRLIRQALARPLRTLRTVGELYRRRLPGPHDAAPHTAHADAIEQIEAMLAPPGCARPPDPRGGDGV